VLDDIRTRFAACGTLAEAIVGGLRMSPPWAIVDVVVQDEYTHDLVFQADGTPDGPAIVLDCT
jgi:hypothetical protein